MKISYLDTIAGISGDMTLGAFISAGVLFDTLKNELQKLGLPGYELEAHHVERSGIAAVKLEVVVSEQPKYHRHLKDINALIDNSGLNAAVKGTAKKIFHEIAVAEAKVHNSTLEKIHFHEVGAIDSLVDIVGTAICLDVLGIEAVYSSPVRVGGHGLVKSAHGYIPVPTPATMEILKNYPTVLTDIETEICTPTGAGIIKALSRGVLAYEQIRVERIGYGAGTKQLPVAPNLLRIMIGTLEEQFHTDEIVSIETNIDDMNPEMFPYVVERLLATGAHDAYLVPVLMKKGRPGMLLSTLVERSRMDAVLAVIFRETTTIGVRIQPVERRKLKREVREMTTSFGIVKVKSVVRDGNAVLVPEFEECKRIAEETSLPLQRVYKQIEREINDRE